MAPKKRNSTGAIKGTFVDVNSVKAGQVVSVKGKVMTKSGLMILDCTSIFLFLSILAHYGISAFPLLVSASTFP